MRHSILGYIC